MTSLATTHLVLNSGCSPNATILDALPEEIVVRILEWCDVEGMLACQRVCLVLCPRFITALIHTSMATVIITAHQTTFVLDLSRFQKHDRRLGDPALQTRPQ